MQGTLPSEPAARAVAAIADGMAGRAPEIAGLLIEEIAVHLPGAIGDEELRELLTAGATANVVLVAQLAASLADPESVPPPAEVVRWARATARAGLSIEDVLGVYRLGHARLWRLWHRELAERCEDPDVLVEAAGLASDFLFRWVDAMSRPVAQIHDAERRRRARGVEAARAEAVRAVLRGEPVPDARLGYALDRAHVALIAWLEEPGDPGEDDARLEEAVGAVVRRLSPGERPLLVHAAPRSVWAWTGGVTTGARLDAGLDDHPGVAIAVGPCGSGAEGFRRSHEDAQVAARTVRARPAAAHRSGVTRYEDVALEALLTADREHARRYAARILGGLDAAGDQAGELTRTLRVYLDTGCSYARAGRALGVHENTVAYRLRRALELLGRDEAWDPELRAALAVAGVLEA